MCGLKSDWTVAAVGSLVGRIPAALCMYTYGCKAMEVNQVMLQGHCFVFWLVYASPPCLAFFGNFMACGLRKRESEGQRKH